MTVSLSKGGNVSLTKVAPNLTKVRVGLGWDPRSSDGDQFDLDASCFLLKDTGKVRTEKDFIFYNNLLSQDGSIQHTGDNRTGEGEGDDESIKIDLARVPAEIIKIPVVVTIDQAQARRQNFGMVSKSFIRILDDATDQEIARYDLGEDFSTETALNFGELYRHQGPSGPEWKFRAVGQGYAGGLASVCAEYGVSAA